MKKTTLIVLIFLVGIVEVCAMVALHAASPAPKENHTRFESMKVGAFFMDGASQDIVEIHDNENHRVYLVFSGAHSVVDVTESSKNIPCPNPRATKNSNGTRAALPNGASNIALQPQPGKV